MVDVFHGVEGDIKQVSPGGTATVGYVTGFSFDIASNREANYFLGSRKVDHWKSGNLEITGTLDKMFVDHSYATAVAGSAVQEYELIGKVQDADGDWYQAQLTGVVFTDRGYEIPEDGMVTESVDFEARDVDLTSGP